MVEQTREPTNGRSLQAGPSEVDNVTPFDMNTRAARLVGRQLAQIGDELESSWREKLPPAWPRPLDLRAYGHILTRAAGYRGLVGSQWWVRIMAAVVKPWLALWRAEWTAWRSRLLPAHWSCWTTGLLASALLLATTAVCIAFWDERRG